MCAPRPAESKLGLIIVHETRAFRILTGINALVLGARRIEPKHVVHISHTRRNYINIYYIIDVCVCV